MVTYYTLANKWACDYGGALIDMAVVAQLVEPSVVVRVVAGSSPVDRPIFLLGML